MPAPLTAEWSVKLGYHINAKLVSNLLYWRNMALFHDADCAIVVDGPEGSGKSVLALQVGKFLDKENTIDIALQVHFDSESVIKAARSLPPGKVIIYDEAGESLDAMESSTKRQKKIRKMFKEVRQRNLIFVLVLPSFYDLQRYFAIHRTRSLIHVYWEPNISEKDEEKYFRRGQYVFYNEWGKKKLYVTDKLRKEYEYPIKWQNEELSVFTGKFPKHYPVDEAAYRKKKAEYSKSLQEDEEEAEQEQMDWRRRVIKTLLHLDREKLLRAGWMGKTCAIIGRGRTWLSQVVKEIETEESPIPVSRAPTSTTLSPKGGGEVVKSQRESEERKDDVRALEVLDAFAEDLE